MKKSKIAVVMLAILCMLYAQGAWAEQKSMGEAFPTRMAVLTDVYRIVTQSDCSIISKRAAKAAASGAESEPEGRILVKQLTGQDVYDLLSRKVEQGGEEYPHFSGLQVELKTLSDGGVRRERVESVHVNNAPIDFEAKYLVALSGDYASGYESYETIASYAPNHALFAQYMASFAQPDNDTNAPVQVTPVPQDDAATDTAADGKAIVQNQTVILFGALGLLLITVAIYLFLRRRKKKEEGQNESL